MPKRPKDQQLAVKAAAWRLRQRGRTHASIGRELGVDESTVSRWMTDLDRRALDRLAADVALAKVFQAGVLGHILEESLDAWDASKKPATRIREIKDPDEQADDGAMKAARKITEVVQQTGDVAYLDRALATLAAIRKLWGLDVAERPNDAGPVVFAERVKALRERAALFESSRRRMETHESETKPDAAPPAENVGPVA